MKNTNQKPSLDMLRNREGLGKSRSIDNNDELDDKKPRKKKGSLFRKIAIGVVVVIVIGLGLLGWKVYSLSSQVIDSDSDRSIFDQLKLLVNSGDEKLKGEEDGRVLCSW